jgi:hypothetical protein
MSTNQSVPTPGHQSVSDTVKPVQPRVNLLEVNITNENAALNVMVGFLGLAQKRGAFAINEAAKLHECISMFQKPVSN